MDVTLAPTPQFSQHAEKLADSIGAEGAGGRLRYYEVYVVNHSSCPVLYMLGCTENQERILLDMD
jgi:hypothetical protein